MGGLVAVPGERRCLGWNVPSIAWGGARLRRAKLARTQAVGGSRRMAPAWFNRCAIAGDGNWSGVDWFLRQHQQLLDDRYNMPLHGNQKLDESGLACFAGSRGHRCRPSVPSKSSNATLLTWRVPSGKNRAPEPVVQRAPWSLRLPNASVITLCRTFLSHCRSGRNFLSGCCWSVCPLRHQHTRDSGPTRGALGQNCPHHTPL